MNSQLPVDEIKKLVFPIAQKYLDLNEYKIVIFGSRADGTAQPTSDIDLGIQGKNPVPRHLLARLREDLKEAQTIHKIDLVDLTAASETFRYEAIKNARMITT